MADYSKFDRIQDSDDEDEAAQRKAEEKERRRQEKAENERSLHSERRGEIDRWLKPRVARLLRSDQPEDGPPELDSPDSLLLRHITDEERNTLAMFVAVTHCGRHETNIERHHDIMDLARQHRWLEEDPGTLALLCQVHRDALKEAGESGALSAVSQEMCDMLISAINTLAAPSKTGCKVGYGQIYAFFAMICEPSTKEAWDAREKYTKKEFAAEALLDSLMPSSLGGDEEFTSGLVWCLVVVLVVLLLAAAAALYFLLQRGGGSTSSRGIADAASSQSHATAQQEL